MHKLIWTVFVSKEASEPQHVDPNGHIQFKPEKISASPSAPAEIYNLSSPLKYLNTKTSIYSA
jgi:hypothetical protein